MAQKRINDLQLRADFDATCNFPTDDLVQTWRVTGAQALAYIQGALDKDAIKAFPIATKTSAYTALITDGVLLADATSAAFTITLPTAASSTGKALFFKKIDSTANIVTIDGASAETIDGSLTISLGTQYASVGIVSNGTAWSVIHRPIVKTFNSDLNTLTYAGSGSYTPATLSTAPIGTFITHTYAINTNTKTQTTSAPTQTTGDMNTNGIQLFIRAFNAASTSGNPARVEIQIGKGLKSFSLNGYTASKALSIQLMGYENGATKYGMAASSASYNEVTGVLIMDAGYTPNGDNSGAVFVASDNSQPTSAYVVIKGYGY